VHGRVGPGCFESAYSPCLAYELAQRGVRFDADVAIDVVYGDLIIPARIESTSSSKTAWFSK
jgi:GxxExxY protein